MREVRNGDIFTIDYNVCSIRRIAEISFLLNRREGNFMLVPMLTKKVSKWYLPWTWGKRRLTVKYIQLTKESNNG